MFGIVFELYHFCRDRGPHEYQYIGNTSIKDTAIWKWKDQLISRTTTALLKMGFLGGQSYKSPSEESETSAAP